MSPSLNRRIEHPSLVVLRIHWLCAVRERVIQTSKGSLLAMYPHCSSATLTPRSEFKSQHHPGVIRHFIRLASSTHSWKSTRQSYSCHTRSIIRQHPAEARGDEFRSSSPLLTKGYLQSLFVNVLRRKQDHLPCVVKVLSLLTRPSLYFAIRKSAPPS